MKGFIRNFCIALCALVVVSFAVTLTLSEPIFVFSSKHVFGNIFPGLMVYLLPPALCVAALGIVAATTRGLKVFRTDKIGIGSKLVILFGSLLLAGVVTALMAETFNPVRVFSDYLPYALSMVWAGLLFAMMFIGINDVTVALIKSDITPKTKNLCGAAFLSLMLTAAAFFFFAVLHSEYGFYDVHDFEVGTLGMLALYVGLSVISFFALWIIFSLFREAKVVAIFAALLYVGVFVFAGGFALSELHRYASYQDIDDYGRSGHDYMLGSNSYSYDDSPVVSDDEEYYDDEYYGEDGDYYDYDSSEFDERNEYNEDGEDLDYLYVSELWDDEAQDSVAVAAAVDYLGTTLDVANSYSLYDKLLPYISCYQSYYAGDLPDTEGRWAYEAIVTFVNESFRDSSVSLRGLFRAYWPIVQAVLSRDAYWEKGYGDMVNNLVTAYDDLYDNYEGYSAFRDIYEHMSSEYYDEKMEDYEFIIQYLSDGRPEEYCDGDNDWGGQGKLIWVYSFWGRRAYDGVAASTYTTLREIQTHYGTEQ